MDTYRYMHTEKDKDSRYFTLITATLSLWKDGAYTATPVLVEHIPCLSTGLSQHVGITSSFDLSCLRLSCFQRSLALLDRR